MCKCMFSARWNQQIWVAQNIRILLYDDNIFDCNLLGLMQCCFGEHDKLKQPQSLTRNNFEQMT